MMNNIIKYKNHLACAEGPKPAALHSSLIRQPRFDAARHSWFDGCENVRTDVFFQRKELRL